MTLKNLIDRSEILKLTPKRRDALLMETFGITQEDLLRIRSYRYTKERVFDAAKTLKQRLEEKGIDSSIIPAQFTLFNIGLIAKGDLKTAPHQLVTNILRKEYRGWMGTTEEETGLRPSYSQLLRQSLGLYKGNLYEAKKVWPELAVSEYDWLKDIRIPTKIGVDEGFLIGVYFAHMTLLAEYVENRNTRRTLLFGKNDHFPLYDKVVLPLMKKIHNFAEMETRHQGPKEEQRRQTRREKGKKAYQYNIPGFEISSLVLTTWLTECLGMPLDRKWIVLPEIEEVAGRFGMLQGTIAAEGHLYVYQNRTRMLVEDPEESYTESVAQLSKEFGLDPREGEKSYGNPYLDYSKSDVLEMARLGLLRNPCHIEAVKPIAGEIAEPLPNHPFRFSREQLRLLAFCYNCNVRASEIVKYFGFEERSTSHFLDATEKHGFKVIRRMRSTMPSHLARNMDDVLKMYDREIPDIPKQQNNNPQE